MTKMFLRVFGNSEGDLGHEGVLLLSETEHHAEKQQLSYYNKDRPIFCSQFTDMRFE